MKQIFLAVLFVSIISCDDTNQQDFTPQLITPILIGQETTGGPYFNFPNSANVSFSEENDWNQFIENYWVQSVNYPEAIIDFNKHIPIICLNEATPDSGYTIDIKSIIEYQDRVVVKTEVINHGGAHTPGRAFIAVKIPKTDKLIVFE